MKNNCKKNINNKWLYTETKTGIIKVKVINYNTETNICQISIPQIYGSCINGIRVRSELFTNYQKALKYFKANC